MSHNDSEHGAEQSGKRNVKTFIYSEDGPGAYPIVLYEILEKSRAEGKAGYRGGHLIAARIGPNGIDGTHRLRSFARGFTAGDDQHLKNLLVALDRGEVSLDAIRDGEALAPDDIDALLEE